MPSNGEKKRAKKPRTKPAGLIASSPSATTAAPTSPPTRAWDEEDGIPTYHVIRFQMIAAAKAALIALTVRTSTLSRSSPIVVATATPNRKGATKCATAARSRASRGRMELDEIVVATTFELSWKPLRKSKIRARARRMMIIEAQWSVVGGPWRVL